MPIGPARMPLMDHLGELRMRLVRIVVCLIIGIVVFYLASPTISQMLLLPIAEYLPEGADSNPLLYVIDPFEAFSVRFYVAFWASVVGCSPVILWQFLAFFLPALKPSERKWFIPTFAAAVALFIFGTVFCYFIILDPAFQWLTDQASGFAELMARANSYIDIIIKFEIAFGFAFELPLIIFYLVIFGVVPYKKLRNSWRVVYIALMVISAMATPDASPVTMLLMFAALILLYEGSLLIARVVLRNRIKAQNDELEKEDAAEAEEALDAKRQKALAKKAVKPSGVKAKPSKPRPPVSKAVKASAEKTRDNSTEKE